MNFMERRGPWGGNTGFKQILDFMEPEDLQDPASNLVMSLMSPVRFLEIRFFKIDLINYAYIYRITFPFSFSN
jgi:hypothetical protein